MMDIIFSTFWGVTLILSILLVFYVIISYEINRFQDKKKQVEGIFVKRVNRVEAYSCVFTIPFPFVAYMANRYSGNMGILFNVIFIFFTSCFLLFSRYIHVAYVKISPEGVEQRIFSSNPMAYPFNVIDTVTYREAFSIDNQDIVGFYTKTGDNIAAFCPIIHRNYRLLAIVRFRIENERWPDMNNSGDIAQVNLLDNGYETIPYFRERKKVTGLADVDM
ncbi:hypothetical protein [uncultured Rothia sp.]|uniref:hypothetical protein n=1 Tax=uncultured Rothia sp. TaxID=316088 RepID=UPI0028EEE5A4|nr:hypothetical protein [uncultured Rothia sp.]